MLTAILGAVAPFLFRFVESKFGPKTGPTKMQTVFAAVKPILEALAASGNITGLPDDHGIKAALESILAAEKRKSDWQETGTLAVGGKTYRVTVIGEL